jgi:eukaryotic-like serine/threonine-protein kinase
MAQGPPSTNPSGVENVYEFGIYRLDVSGGSLFRSGEFIALQPKVFQTLLVLVEAAGRIVTKDDLMQKVWPDAFVEEGSLANNISTLRKLLNPDFDDDGPIATVPKRGYRFTAGVNVRSAGGNIAVRSPAMALPENEDRLHLAWTEKSWKLILLLACSLLIVAAGSFAGYRYLHRPNITERDTIVITDFANKTGDTVFDDALKQALTLDLEQSPRLNIVTERRLAATLVMMGRSPEDQVVGETARELCIREGSKAMLTGSVSSIGNEYLIGLQAINCATGDSIASDQARASGRDNVLHALDQAASRIREKLGESLASVQKYSSPIDELTTPSLEALKTFSIGRRIANSRGDLLALPYIERAVALDNNFAVAWSGLSLNYSNLGEPTRSAQAAKKAFELRGRVSDLERFRIEGTYYLDVTGQLDEALNTYDLWYREYPRDPPSISNAGNVYTLLGQWENALNATVKAMDLAPSDYVIAGNLGPIQTALNKFDDAQKTITDAMAHTPDTFVLRLPQYQLDFLKGDAADMDTQVKWAEAHPGDGDWIIDSEGDTEAYHGRLKSALSYFDRAISAGKSHDNAENAAAWQAKVAMIAAEFGDADLARRYAQGALKSMPGRDVKTYAALALARVGDAAQATKLADELNKDFPLNTQIQKYWLPSIHAALALHARNPAEAISDLEPAAPLDLALSFPLDYSTMYPIWLRGQAYLDLHQGQQAAAQFQEIIDNRGAIVSFPIASLAQLGLARAYAIEGDKTKSRAAFDRFFELWKDADARIPVLREAQSERAQVN